MADLQITPQGDDDQGKSTPKPEETNALDGLQEANMEEAPQADQPEQSPVINLNEDSTTEPVQSEAPEPQPEAQPEAQPEPQPEPQPAEQPSEAQMPNLEQLHEQVEQEAPTEEISEEVTEVKKKKKFPVLGYVGIAIVAVATIVGAVLYLNSGEPLEGQVTGTAKYCPDDMWRPIPLGQNSKTGFASLLAQINPDHCIDIDYNDCGLLDVLNKASDAYYVNPDTRITVARTYYNTCFNCNELEDEYFKLYNSTESGDDVRAEHALKIYDEKCADCSSLGLLNPEDLTCSEISVPGASGPPPASNVPETESCTNRNEFDNDGRCECLEDYYNMDTGDIISDSEVRAKFDKYGVEINSETVGLCMDCASLFELRDAYDAQRSTVETENLSPDGEFDRLYDDILNALDELSCEEEVTCENNHEFPDSNNDGLCTCEDGYFEHGFGDYSTDLEVQRIFTSIANSGEAGALEIDTEEVGVCMSCNGLEDLRNQLIEALEGPDFTEEEENLQMWIENITTQMTNNDCTLPPPEIEIPPPGGGLQCEESEITVDVGDTTSDDQVLTYFSDYGTDLQISLQPEQASYCMTCESIIDLRDVLSSWMDTVEGQAVSGELVDRISFLENLIEQNDCIQEPPEEEDPPVGDDPPEEEDPCLGEYTFTSENAGECEYDCETIINDLDYLLDNPTETVQTLGPDTDPLDIGDIEQLLRSHPICLEDDTPPPGGNNPPGGDSPPVVQTPPEDVIPPPEVIEPPEDTVTVPPPTPPTTVQTPPDSDVPEPPQETTTIIPPPPPAPEPEPVTEPEPEPEPEPELRPAAPEPAPAPTPTPAEALEEIPEEVSDTGPEVVLYVMIILASQLYIFRRRINDFLSR
ncbi:hypothetical protein GF340_01920 [Candidatus Peregrinibacteria bacterium]|nr:hypothetical protein [Candidatus Peregrinibacteria bacterium]